MLIAIINVGNYYNPSNNFLGCFLTAGKHMTKTACAPGSVRSDPCVKYLSGASTWISLSWEPEYIEETLMGVHVTAMSNQKIANAHSGTQQLETLLCLPDVATFA